mmetsp:Transcript_21516/g.72968  ORF Transcript_21516/g.72968 Transcript_21516/m.72968 type:complete len:213 (+) Transcript_21516:187-825(+)
MMATSLSYEHAATPLPQGESETSTASFVNAAIVFAGLEDESKVSQTSTPNAADATKRRRPDAEKQHLFSRMAFFASLSPEKVLTGPFARTSYKNAPRDSVASPTPNPLAWYLQPLTSPPSAALKPGWRSAPCGLLELTFQSMTLPSLLQEMNSPGFVGCKSRPLTSLSWPRKTAKRMSSAFEDKFATLKMPRVPSPDDVSNVSSSKNRAPEM